MKFNLIDILVSVALIAGYLVGLPRLLEALPRLAGARWAVEESCAMWAWLPGVS